MSKKEFKAESKRLLDLMINSIYTHKEIFLREIISNASDAIDKLCYLSLTDDKVGLTRDQFEIRLSIDKEHRLLTVSDNGIGMDEAALENLLLPAFHLHLLVQPHPDAVQHGVVGGHHPGDLLRPLRLCVGVQIPGICVPHGFFQLGHGNHESPVEI